MSKESVINEKKNEFKDIEKYTEQQAVNEIEKRIQPKIKEMINKSIKENVSIKTDGTSIEISDESIEVVKNDSTVSVDTSGNQEIEDVVDPIVDIEVDSEEGIEDILDDESSEEVLFEVVSSLREEEGMSTEEVVSNPFDSIMKKLNAIESKLEGGSQEEPKAEGEVTIVDDETSTEVPTAEAPTAEAPTAEAPTAEVPTAPTPSVESPVIQEFNMEDFEDSEEINDEDQLVKEIMKQLEENEFSLEDEIEEMVSEDDSEEFELEDDSDELEIEDDLSDDSEELEIEDDLSDDSDELEIEMEEVPGDDCGCEITSQDDDSISIEIEMSNDDTIEIVDSEDEDSEGEIDEMLGLGLATKRVDKSFVPHVPHKEINEIKAQYESKLDELIKENGSLKKDIKEFEESFVELRNSIDEMQTFNAKLALANKLFLGGGLSSEDKMKINEALDSASTVKEAQKIYQTLSKDSNSIIKESKVSDKIKSKATIVANNDKPAYQSNELKTLKEGISRNQILAGIREIEN